MGGFSLFAPFFLSLPLLPRESPFFPRVFSSPFRLATVVRVVRVVFDRCAPLPARSPRRCLRIVALVPPTATPVRLTVPPSTNISRPRHSLAPVARSLDRSRTPRVRLSPRAPRPSVTRPSPVRRPLAHRRARSSTDAVRPPPGWLFSDVL